jgi:hypothetical protein
LLLLEARHRLDDRLDADQLAIVEVHVVGEAAGEHAAEGELVDEVLQRPHLLDHPHLLEEVLEGELAREHALGVPLGLLLIDDLLEVLHEADDVAHAQDAARHALGAELLELVESSRPCRQNFTGAPVTSLTLMAAPPRASPSSLVSTTP